MKHLAAINHLVNCFPDVILSADTVRAYCLELAVLDEETVFHRVHFFARTSQTFPRICDFFSCR